MSSRRAAGYGEQAWKVRKCSASSAADLSSTREESAMASRSTFTVRINNIAVLVCGCRGRRDGVGGRTCSAHFVHIVIATCICSWLICKLLPNKNTSIDRDASTYVPFQVDNGLTEEFGASQGPVERSRVPRRRALHHRGCRSTSPSVDMKFG